MQELTYQHKMEFIRWSLGNPSAEIIGIKLGDYGGSAVRNWLSGKIVTPHPRSRRDIDKLFNSEVKALEKAVKDGE